MRQCRVGTISMGMVLIILGVVLLVSHFNGLDVLKIAMAWFPIILIVLGIEIICYLYVSKQEQPIVKYDLLSIIFIGFIGSISIIMYVAISSGLLSTISDTVNAESVEGALPTIDYSLGDEVKRVVIEPADVQISIETNTSDTLNIFGTFEANVVNSPTIKPENIAYIVETGDTLHIKLLKARTSEKLIGNHFQQFNFLISVPNDVNVEVRTTVQKVHMKMDELHANWFVESADEVYVNNYNGSNVEFSALVNSINNMDDLSWDKQMEQEGSEGYQTPIQIEKVFGTGKNKLIFDEIEYLIIRD
ncbi:hypothetical protein [Aquibacillus rhizosphaerae]|uniref:Exosporium protein E n=1 Tax=Aquibacillus rhizosphaerae TaxID=3051431 RepID=A0ABT7LAI5_9BACI|nr:hypothetical protein [Aquibacillus sp. LR5S19]MDL4842272.1 hypothetical protein [Aquibacillus sp. LR5S19]